MFLASPCDRNAKCLNTDGSFTCKCKQDFAGDGFKCKSTLVDEEGFRITFFTRCENSQFQLIEKQSENVRKPK